MKQPKNAVSRPSRSENMKRLITALRKGSLNRHQVAEILKVSPENAGTYLSELKSQGIVYFARPDIPNLGGYTRTAYVLIANEHAVTVYLASLDAPVSPAVRQARLIAERVRREAKATPPRIETTKVDPLALPEGFFKPSAEKCFQPAERTERAPAKPTGFAALATVRFQLASEVCA